MTVFFILHQLPSVTPVYGGPLLFIYETVQVILPNEVYSDSSIITQKKKKNHKEFPSLLRAREVFLPLQETDTLVITQIPAVCG